MSSVYATLFLVLFRGVGVFEPLLGVFEPLLDVFEPLLGVAALDFALDVLEPFLGDALRGVRLLNPLSLVRCLTRTCCACS